MHLLVGFALVRHGRSVDGKVGKRLPENLLEICGGRIYSCDPDACDRRRSSCLDRWLGRKLEERFEVIFGLGREDIRWQCHLEAYCPGLYIPPSISTTERHRVDAKRYLNCCIPMGKSIR